MVRFAREHLEELRGVKPRGHRPRPERCCGPSSGLDVESMASGPQGGDLQIGARIVDGRIDGVIFFRDPLTSHPHEPDIQAVLKVCDVHDVPLATNRASALLLIRSLHHDGHAVAAPRPSGRVCR